MINLLFSLVVLSSFMEISKAQCTEAHRLAFLENLKDPQCRKAFRHANYTPVVEELNLLCTEDCIGAISEWYASPICNDSFTSNGLTYWCQQADGGRISHCHFIDGTVFSNDNIIGCANFLGNQTVCPANCDAGLRNIANEIGCCYQVIYNSTDDLNVLQRAGYLNQQARDFFEILRMSALWSTCGVSEIPKCTSPTFKKSTTPTVASGLIISPSVVIVFLMLALAAFAY